MISVQLANVTLILGARPIFRDLTWSIQHDQKIGLIGPNGAGKSSLLKLITGEYTPEPGGTPQPRPRGDGRLPAAAGGAGPDQKVFAAAMAGNPRWWEVRTALEEVEGRMAEPQVYNNPKALARRCTNRPASGGIRCLGGESYPERVAEILRGLGLPRQDFGKPVGLLSGGQKKLVGLARLLLSRPDVLLLDEPDNHLDLPGKVFLEAADPRVPRGGGDRLARPLPAGCGGHPHRRDGRWQADNFHGDYSSIYPG